MLTRRVPRRATGRGFTIVELMVTISVLAILMALAMPSMSTWIKNGQVRSTGDALQNGLRMAQAEALRRSRQVVFVLTDSSSPQTTLEAKAGGKYWAIKTVALSDADAADTAQFIESGVVGLPGSDVAIDGPAALCFSSLGRLTTNSSTGVTGADCSALPTSTPTYALTLAGADRNLKVTVALGGQVRMCDPNKTLSSSNPDGCLP